MTIENNLLAITNAMFKDRQNWKWVSNEQKEEFFFIINRLLSKRFAEKAQLLNHKNINKAVGLDLWFQFLKKSPYPSWIWSKSEKVSQHISEQDYMLLLTHLQIKDSDLDYLIQNHPDFINDGLKYYKKLEKQ